MNFHNYISSKISAHRSGKKSIARPIVRIAVGGIALGRVVMTLTLSIVTGFQNEISNKVIGFGSHISIVKLDNNTSFEPQPMPQHQSFVKELEANQEIKHIQVFATKNGIIKTKTDNEGIIIKGVDKGYNWHFLEKNLVEGKKIAFNDSAASKEVLISKSIADKLGLKLGEKLLVYFINKKQANDSTDFIEYEERVRDFQICGIYETGFEELDSKTVFADIAQIRKLNYWAPGEVGGFELEVTDFKKIHQTTEEVNDLIGYSLSAQSIQENNPG
ncbi:MAG TPA: ABC transporter permease, partial [Bacteroidia bacterium]